MKVVISLDTGKRVAKNDAQTEFLNAFLKHCLEYLKYLQSKVEKQKHENCSMLNVHGGRCA